jgi:cytochrome b6-f complex iron-sulfur subunit
MAQLSGTPDVPDLGRRQFMNLLMVGSGAATVLGALYPVIKYFIPPSSGGAGGGVIAKDHWGTILSPASFSPATM